MREELNIFVDPQKKVVLELKVSQKKRGHIISGSLYNREARFPIIGGIPRFVKSSFYQANGIDSLEGQTSDSFGNKWNDWRYQRLGLKKQDIRILQEQFMAVLGCSTKAQIEDIMKKSRRVLNAGCGVAWPEYLFNKNPQAQRHCIDISLSVETAYKNTKKFPNVIVSQASIFQLPYRDEVFDLIYSIGVIHHTPEPKTALKSLIDKLSPGGLIGIYVYNKKPILRELADREIRQITTKMDYADCMKFSKMMTNFGMALSKINRSVVIKDDIPILGIRRGKYSVHRLIYDYFLKCWYNPKQDKKYADLVNQDWYHPYYAWHYSKYEIKEWFKDLGIKKVRFIQPKGWKHSGYFVSGRKA